MDLLYKQTPLQCWSTAPGQGEGHIMAKRVQCRLLYVGQGTRCVAEGEAVQQPNDSLSASRQADLIPQAPVSSWRVCS